MRIRTLGSAATLLIVALAFFAASDEAAAQCEYRRWEHVKQLASQDWSGHRSGNHRSFARAKFTCVCAHDCRSTCTPSWDGSRSKRCVDSGRLVGVSAHRAYSKDLLQAGSKPNALSDGGADCGAGFGCFIEECPFGVCRGIAITVKGEPIGVGFGVSFTARPAPLWTGELDMPFECDPCWTIRQVADELRQTGKEQVPVDGYDPGGGGTVWQTCYWSCRSWVDAQGRYQEYCELKDCLIM